MPEFINKLTREDMVFLSPVIAMVGILAGSFIAAIFPFLTALFTRRSEDRRQFRQLAIQAALDNWKYRNQLELEMMKASGKGNFKIDCSPDIYIIHMLLVMDIVSDRSLTVDRAVEMIKRKSRNAPKTKEPDA